MAASYSPGGVDITKPPPLMMPPAYPPTVVMAQPGPMMTAATIQMGSNALSYLEAVDQLVLRQEIHLSEVLFNFKSNVRFKVVNSQGQPVFTAEEENDCCTRNCLGASRPFAIHIKDNMGIPLVVLHRPFRCCGCCLPCCCLQEMTVEYPDGRIIGVIKETCNIFTPLYSIEDDAGNKLFNIVGDCCPGAICYCGRDIHFNVIDAVSNQEIGVVTKQWAGLMQEGFTNATNYGVSFPLQMPIAHKTLLLSLTFLINFMYFEWKDNNRGNSSGAGAS